MKNKWYILVFLIFIFLIFFFFLRDNKNQSLQKRTMSGPVVAFGDSLIYGIGAESSDNFISKLSYAVGQPIINLGIPGNTTADGVLRLNTLISLNPSIVIVLLGGNDYLKRVPVQETFSNLDTIVSELKKREIVVVLLGIQGGVLSDPFDKEFKNLAKKYNIDYIPNVLSGIIGNSKLMSDAVHPNADGYQKIFEKVYPTLKSILES